LSAGERRDAERGRLHELMAVSSAESAVDSACIRQLRAAQERAWRPHTAAKGQLTRARKDGGAGKIAAAIERERQAYAEFDRISRDVIEEMLAINGRRCRAGRHHGQELRGHVM
jgi:hypothetical protein